MIALDALPGIVMGSKIIQFELNEVPWRVIDDFVVDRPRSQLARLLPQARAYRTRADDSALSPWITWPTVHRGVTDEEHLISDFGQDLTEADRAFAPIWSILARGGTPTGVCGSLHSSPMPADASQYAFYLPDAFATNSSAFPAPMDAFQDLNLAMSRESARNVKRSIPLQKALRFLAHAPGLGISARTALGVGRQLADEIRRPWTKVRRRTLQVLLTFDVFMAQLNRTKPTFSTFFTNHVASSMHRYWAAAYPGDYATFALEPESVKTYGGEIAWAMTKLDELLARIVAFLRRNREYELWIVSSMGQAATEAIQVRTQVYLEDVGAFMSALGVPPADWTRRPAMLPRVVVALRRGRSEAFERYLDSVRVAGCALSWTAIGPGVYRIHPGTLQNVTDETCSVDGRSATFQELGFKNVPIQDEVGQTAYHVPEGSLLIVGAGPANAGRPVIPTTEVAPSILARLGAPVPTYMQRPANL